jgi:thymidylate kinase
MKRFNERSEKEIFETKESLIKVRKKSLKLVRNWYIIDTSDSIKSTFKKIEKILIFLDKSR